MTTTTRTTECTAPAATLFMAFELGSTKWTLAFTTAPAQRPRFRTVAAGDLTAVIREIADAKMRFHVAADRPVRSCYEAGRDGFWLHRWLRAQGIDNLVVDSSSIEVNRRKRRAKTDRLDAAKLLSLLQRWAAGETKVWSVVHVPSVEAEDARQLVREIETVHATWTAQRNRLHGLLAAHGAVVPLTRRFADALATTTTGDGRPLPPGLRARVRREWAAYQTIDQRLGELEALRAQVIAADASRMAQVARQLMTLKGVGEIGAVVFSAELLGTRTLHNRREVGALTGFAPVPYRSDQRVVDQGISRGGRAALRRVATQVAWCWLRYQPTSALTQWYHRRFGAAGKRARRHCRRRATLDHRAVALRDARGDSRRCHLEAAAGIDGSRRAEHARVQLLVRAARLASGFIGDRVTDGAARITGPGAWRIWCVTGRHHGWKVLGSTDPIDTDRQQRTSADRDGHE